MQTASLSERLTQDKLVDAIMQEGMWPAARTSRIQQRLPLAGQAHAQALTGPKRTQIFGSACL